MNSRNKGAAGERELAGCLRDTLGIDARRGQQFSGLEGQDVVHSLPGVHIECKRVEKLNLTNAVGQATRDAREKVPVVMHRKNREEWLVTVPLARLVELCEIVTNR